MARVAGISPASVQRIWAANDIKPHLKRTLKLSNDPQFEEKFWDVIGLYLAPPDKALVLCCDEKSQVQALQRTQPGLPLGIGHIRTQTHDYVRHGTLTLFAAMDYLQDRLISSIETQHRHQEWLGGLRFQVQQSVDSVEPIGCQQLQMIRQHFNREFPAQCLTRSGVEQVGNLVQPLLANQRQIGALG